MAWFIKVPSIIFTRLKTEFNEELKTKYNIIDKNFSTAMSNDVPAVFPFISIKTLPSYSSSNDLERNEIETVNFMFQIEVFDNKSQFRTNEVMSEVIDIFVKKLHFEITSIPYFDNKQGVHRLVARANRTIDINDVL